MEKILILFTVFFTFCLSAFAEYKPIPKELSKQYKTEMEKVIKKEYKVRFNNIKNYDKHILAEEPESRYTAIDMGLQSEIFYFIISLIDITNKYTNIKEDIPITDCWIDIYDVLLPYLKDNNINTKPINKLIRYSEEKENLLRKKFLTKNDYFRDFSNIGQGIAYNYRKLKYNKLKNTYTTDIAIDLSEINLSYKYKYPYKNGYITHLIFKIEIKDSNFYIKYKGFVANDIATKDNYSTRSSNIIAIEMTKPNIPENVELIEKYIYKQLDSYILKKIIKSSEDI